jgi:hypothetical protein
MAPKPMTLRLPIPLRIFLFLSIALDGVCVAMMEAWKHLLHRGYPYTSPFIPFHHFNDLIIFLPRFQYIHGPDFFSEAVPLGAPFTYPAPAALLYGFFYVWHPVALFFLTTAALILVLGAILGRAMVRRGARPWAAFLFLFAAGVLSYPFWFEFLLGNMEICVFLIVAFAVVALLRERFTLFATLIGVAASIKIFPFVYLALLLPRKKYKELAIGIAAAAVTTLAALRFESPSLPAAIHGTLAGLAEFKRYYILHFIPIETGFDHSIFGLIKAIAHRSIGVAMPSGLFTAYMALVCVAGLALYFARIHCLPIANQVLCLSVASILLPPASHDYTLIYLYIPWGLMVLCAMDQARTGRRVDGLVAAFVCFAILMSAESELIYKAHGHSGQLKAVVLVVLMYIGLKYPFELSGDPDARMVFQT